MPKAAPLRFSAKSNATDLGVFWFTRLRRHGRAFFGLFTKVRSASAKSSERRPTSLVRVAYGDHVCTVASTAFASNTVDKVIQFNMG